MNVTLDNTQRTTLRSVAVMALENRPLPNHWLEDGSLYHNLASAIQQLDHPDTDASLLDRLHRLASAIQQLDHPDTDASLLDRLHRAEAEREIARCELRAAYDAMRLILTRNSDDTGRTYDELLLWLDTNRPKEATE